MNTDGMNDGANTDGMNTDGMNTDERSDADSPDDRARLAVLEVALAERLAGEAPPDLWSRLHAAGGNTRTAPRRQWLVAALLLLALGAAAVFAVSRAQPAERAATAPADDSASPGGPRTLAALQERLRAAKSADLRARGSFCAGTNTWVHWGRQPLDAFLRTGLAPAVDGDDLEAVVAAIESAARSERRDDVVWTHEIVVLSGDIGSGLLLQVGGPGAPRLAFRSPEGAVQIDAPAFPFDRLREPLTEITKTSIAKLGLVIGPTGFADMPSAATSLRLLDVPAAAASELPRFAQLRQLDLTRSPQWHSAAVLRQLPVATLQELTLSPTLLAAEHYAALGALTNLRELFLVGGDAMRVYMGLERTAAAPTLDAAALRSLAGLTQLKELALGGGSFDDDALRQLAALPLERLALIDCPRVRGPGLAALPRMRALLLRGDELASDVIAHTASMPELFELSVFAPHGSLDLSPLPRLPKLRKLLLDVGCDRGQFVFLERCQALEGLGLRVSPPLRDDELVLLHGLHELGRLRSLRIASARVSPDGLAALRQALPGVTVGQELW